MVKTITLLFACFVLAAVANAKPLSDEESSQTVTNSVISEDKTRSKRHLEGILQSIGDMVEGIIHEVGVHRRDRFGYNQQNIIGNGRGNTNYITYNYK